MWRHPIRLAIWVGLIVLALALSIWRLIRHGSGSYQENLQRYIDQLDEPGFYIANGLVFAIAIIWAVLRYIQRAR
jgi:hypothetical protein